MDAIQSFTEEDNAKDRQFVTALARGLEILRCFRPGEASLTNSEMTQQTGRPKRPSRPLTYALTRLGYLT